MDKLDDIESTNALEWDSQPSETVPDVQPTAKASMTMPEGSMVQGEGLKQVQDIDYSGAGVSSGKIYKDSGVQTGVLKGTYALRQDQRLDDKHRRTGQVQIEKSSDWSKLYAVSTKRKQEHMDKEAENATKERKFLGPPLHDDFAAVGYYLWHDHSIGPTELLTDDLKLLNDVRMEFQVFIDYEESLGCIRLRSELSQNIEPAIAGVQAKIKHAEAEAGGLAPFYIVEPPSVTAMKSEVAPKFKRIKHPNQLFAIERVILSGSILSAEQKVAWEIERESILKSNEKHLSGYLRDAFVGFRALKTGMQMRVHFGRFRLFQYRKDFNNSTYSFQKFAKMMGESRTKADLEKDVGNELGITDLLSQLKKASDVFEPTDSVTSSLSATEPRHCLVVVACGPSKVQVRIEADMDMVDGTAEGLKVGGWQVGTTKYYQQNAHKLRLAVGVLDLESLDWTLEIITDETIVNPPKAFRDLVVKSVRTAPTGTVEGPGIGYPSITPIIPHGVTIITFWTRSILRYQLKGTSYILEIALYRGWENGESIRAPSIKCYIKFYHKEWDLLMVQDQNVTGCRDWDLHSFFPAASTSEPGFSDFLTKVQAIQSFFKSFPTRLDHDTL